MEEELNVWDIIDTYFRDTPKYKSLHQLDSFNEFIFSEVNGIKHIIKRENPLIIYKDSLNSNATSYKYEMMIYFGESIYYNKEESTFGELVPDIENIFISSPIEYQDGKGKYMYPNVARLKGYTYGSNIFCNIGIIFKNNETDETNVINFPKVNLGTVPIMIHSKMCILNNLDSVQLTNLGECPYDQGGYFIIKGKEKVIISQENKINNILYIHESHEDNVVLQAVIKSVSKEGFQSSRTNVISLAETKVFTNGNPSRFRFIANRILIRILGIDIKIPIFILLRALGFKNDKEIFSHIIYSTDNKEIKDNLMNILRFSAKDSEPIYSQKDAYNLLAIHTKGKERINVINILNNNLLPHYDSNQEKAFFIAYSVRRLLLTHLGVLPKTDRDSYANKRVDLAGPLLLELYRELWGNFQRNVSLTIDNEYKFNFKNGADFTKIINDVNYKRIFNCKILDNIVKSFGSVFGTGLSGRQGIVQDLNRLSMLGTLSHIRRLSFPMPSGSKSLGPRKLHNSQWGFVCPSESPDGSNVGIINHLSIVANVTSNIMTDGILEALDYLNMIRVKDSVSYEINEYCKIFVNGKWAGIHNNPPLLYKLLRLFKLNSIINILTSISWNIELNELHIFTDSGRIVRPVFVLRDDNSNDLLNGNLTLIQNWKKSIHGYLYNIDDINVSLYDSKFYKDIIDDLKLKEKDFIGFLENHQSVIEYIDPTESNTFLIAKDYRSIDKNYTHCEIHSSLILSAVALNIPFPEHSQAPRNVFSCQQTKQAVGTYSSAYNTRFDTFGNILHYPQKALTTTRYKKYTDVDKLPYGCNCIVAIASYSGYNQEDAVILNKTSVDRGMFQSIYYRSYEESEETKYGVVSSFSNPKYQKNVKKKDLSKFSKLDENGFVKENTFVDHNDAFVAKCTLNKSEDGDYTTVSGTSVKFGTYGKVDKVVVFENKDGLRTCKVRIRKHRIPEIGDKFSSRPGQKGVCGLLIDEKDMPFSKDGIVPDLIVNPHAIPSRMTINQLLEMILGKSASLGGFLGDATPFQNKEITDYTKLLNNYGYEGMGNEVLYSGITGEQIKTSIFMGPIYYQRLKIMVSDKIHSRATGPLQSLTRQPAGGRANDGGFRVGEMERDSIIAHGVSSFLRESMMERSDKYSVLVDEKTGLIDYNDDSQKVNVEMPYAMKLLIQELQTMSINARLITNKDIPNPAVFLSIVKNLSNKEMIFDVIGEENFDDDPTYAPDSPLPSEGDDENDEKDEKDDFDDFMKRKIEGEGICEDLTKIKIPKSKQTEYRKKIYDEIMNKIDDELTVKNMKKLLTDEILIEMFELYDKYFFDDKIKDWNKIGKCGWRICWADKCSVNIFGETGLDEKSKGGTQYIKLMINDKAFIKAIDNFLKNDDEVMEKAGIECNDILSCIQLTFEHEMIHGIMFCLCRNYMIRNGPGDWKGKIHNKSAHSKTFMSILHNIFGHDDYESDIFNDKKTKEQIKKVMEENDRLFKENKKNLSVGDKVVFDGKVNKKITKVSGVINKKNPKKAVITDEKGSTWNVRYNLLMKS